NVSRNHLNAFYSTFDEIKQYRYDGMIITGAPIEHLHFTDVNYWEELTEIMDWSNDHVTSVMHICWGAQAALYHHYGIGKHELPTKCFGIFEHTVSDPTINLVRGFDEIYLAPHSRHTTVLKEEIENDPRLILLSTSEKAGGFMVKSKESKQIMINGHVERDAIT